MTTILDKTSAKILVLGDSGVGKSSLIYLICHSASLSSAQWTIGCSIDVKLYGNCFLEFWDIGGSRGHKIARSFLYQDYQGIVLVFDATNKKSRLNLAEWLREVSQKANDKDLDAYVNVNVPTITIGTRKDQLTYAALMEIENQDSRDNSAILMNGNTSVVDFNRGSSTATTNSHHRDPYRRDNIQDQYSLNNFSSYSSSPSTSFQSTLSSTSLNEPLLCGSIANPSPVIYVNTQDAMSCSVGTKNYEKLNSFFKLVIERRNKRFYNKFAI